MRHGYAYDVTYDILMQSDQPRLSIWSVRQVSGLLLADLTPIGIRIMVGCAVKSCRKRQYKGSGIHFFSFPTDAKHRDIWIERICRENFEPTVHSRVCSLHFEDSCFEKDPAVLKSIDWKLDRPKIKHDAVPTIALEDDIEFDEKLVNGESRVARPTWSGLGQAGKTAKQQETKNNRRFKKKKKKCQVSKFLDLSLSTTFFSAWMELMESQTNKKLGQGWKEVHKVHIISGAHISACYLS